jgi:hypothetical protein
MSQLATILSFETLHELSPDDLSKVLQVSLDFLRRSRKSDVPQNLERLLNVLRAAPETFLVQNAAAIFGGLNSVVGHRLCDLSSVGLLNVVGEAAKKVQDAAFFVQGDPISFHNLLPLVVADNHKVSQRAAGIFAVIIFGSVKEADPQLLFAALMSIFCGLQNDASGYVAMAGNLIDSVERAGEVKAEWIELLGNVMEPVLAVGDQSCVHGVAGFLKFLSKVALREDEVGEKAIGLMTRFGLPKMDIVPKKHI